MPKPMSDERLAAMRTGIWTHTSRELLAEIDRLRATVERQRADNLDLHRRLLAEQGAQHPADGRESDATARTDVPTATETDGTLREAQGADARPATRLCPDCGCPPRSLAHANRCRNRTTNGDADG